MSVSSQLMSVRLQLTKDHSHTLYVPELDETYHSRNGAIEEANYVYLGRGLEDWLNNNESPGLVSILEIGFGTGLNAWLTALACEQKGISCDYVSLETFPLPPELTAQLNYTDQSNDTERRLFHQLHEADWNIPVAVSANFQLSKLNISLQEFAAAQTSDIIYFDAFAPEKQPELWTAELFQKLYDCLNPGGYIVTYSSKGEIKRTWKKIGFDVERLPGPPMKRHMLRGHKSEIRIPKFEKNSAV